MMPPGTPSPVATTYTPGATRCTMLRFRDEIRQAALAVGSNKDVEIKHLITELSNTWEDLDGLIITGSSA